MCTPTRGAGLPVPHIGPPLARPRRRSYPSEWSGSRIIVNARIVVDAGGADFRVAFAPGYSAEVLEGMLERVQMVLRRAREDFAANAAAGVTA